MSKEMLVIALGVWIIITPYLGVPGSWRTVILIISGLLLILLGFFLRAEVVSRGGKRSAHHPFVENSEAVPEWQEGEHHDRKERITSLN